MKKLLIILALLPVLSMGGSYWSCSGASPSAAGDEVTMKILDRAVSYIRANHPDAASLLPDAGSFTRSGGTGKDIEGYSGVTYKGGGWTISIGHAIVPNFVWGIKADYGNGKIVWTGTDRDGQITEESYITSY